MLIKDKNLSRNQRQITLFQNLSWQSYSAQLAEMNNYYKKYFSALHRSAGILASPEKALLSNAKFGLKEYSHSTYFQVIVATYKSQLIGHVEFLLESQPFHFI